VAAALTRGGVLTGFVCREEVDGGVTLYVMVELPESVGCCVPLAGSAFSAADCGQWGALVLSDGVAVARERCGLAWGGRACAWQAECGTGAVAPRCACRVNAELNVCQLGIPIRACLVRSAGGFSRCVCPCGLASRATNGDPSPPLPPSFD
jgi:hypothetical protein